MNEKSFYIYFSSGIVWCCMGSGVSVGGLPNWYLKSPNNDKNRIYGVGEGLNLKSAKANALNDMALRLSVEVASKYQQRKRVTNHSYSRDVQENINIEVKNLIRSGYRLHNTDK